MNSKRNKTKKKWKFDLISPVSWNRSRLIHILDQFKGKKLVVLGDVGIDRYTVGSVERISPEAPVPVVLVEEEILKLGLAANVADNIQVLNGIPILIGLIGSDSEARDFKAMLKSHRMTAQYLVTDKTRRTVLKERVVSERQQLLRIDYESNHLIKNDIENKLLSRFKKSVLNADGVIIEDYSKGTLTKKLIQSAIRIAQKNKKLIALDPNSRTPLENYYGASILTPNTKEAEVLSGVLIRDDESLIQAGELLLKSTQASYIVITRGKAGMAIFTKGSKKVSLIPTFAKEVYDVSGAGDTVISVMTLAMASGAFIEEACVLGNLAAGVEVGKRGTATVHPDEIRSEILSNLK